MRENLIVSNRGHILLPAKMRNRLGIKPGGVVTVEEREGELVLRPAAVVDIELYSDEQIAQWDKADALEETERRAILERLTTTEP